MSRSAIIALPSVPASRPSRPPDPRGAHPATAASDGTWLSRMSARHPPRRRLALGRGTDPCHGWLRVCASDGFFMNKMESSTRTGQRRASDPPPGSCVPRVSSPCLLPSTNAPSSPFSPQKLQPILRPIPTRRAQHPSAATFGEAANIQYP
jgi:hypothetical protein